MKLRLLNALLFGLTVLFMNSCLNFKDKYELIPVNSDSKWGYIDKTGKYVINPQFAEANLFSDDLALVKDKSSEGQYGYINKEGIYIIKPQYKYATSFSEGLAWVTPSLSYPQLINTKGEKIAELKSAIMVYDFIDGLAAFVNDKNLYGFVNKKGEVVINPQFKDVGYFSEDLCAVKNDKGEVGFIDKEGKLVINYQFQDFGTLDFFAFHDDMCVVVGKNGKEGLINKEGKFEINPQYDYLFDNYNGMFGFRMDDKLGWIDKTGKVLINPQFEDYSQFVVGDLAPIHSGKNYGYIDKTGLYKINPQFESAGYFFGKLAAVKSGNKYGFIDAEGKYVINPQFDDVHSEVMYPSKRPRKRYVFSDYLNTSELVSFLKPSSEGGFNGDTFSSTLNDLLVSYKLDRENLNGYVNQLALSTDLVISSNFTVDYYATFLKMGEYKEVVDGWYTTQKFIPSYNEKPWLYQVVVRLNGDAIGRASDVVAMISTKYTATLDPRSTENNKVFEVDNNTLLLIRRMDSSKVLIAYIKKKHLTTDLFAFDRGKSDKSSSRAAYAPVDTAAADTDYYPADTASYGY